MPTDRVGTLSHLRASHFDYFIQTAIAKGLLLVYDSHMNGKTATAVAKELNCSVATVTRWAKELRLGTRYAHCFVLSADEVKKIRRAWKPTRGCKPKV